MNIIQKILDFFKEKKQIIVWIVVLIILILAVVIYFQQKRIANLKDKYQTEVKLRDALADSVHNYQNEHGEWVAEKLTLQADIKDLKKMNGQLTTSQKELLAKIDEVEKENSIIAAALIETNVIINSLKPYKVYIDTARRNIAFADSTKDLKYHINVGRVMPAYLDSLPTLAFKQFILPNEQFIEFHWKNDKKKGYPISFSVTNTNEYFKTVNIDSYAIKPITKEKLDPNGWQKIGNFFIRNGKTVAAVTVGAIGGATAFWLLTR
jgi:hypothetical protein